MKRSTPVKHTGPPEQEGNMGADARPRVAVGKDAPTLPCCGASANDQRFCHTLNIPHLLYCECGALWECEDFTEDRIDLVARREAECRGIQTGREWWGEEDAA